MSWSELWEVFTQEVLAIQVSNTQALTVRREKEKKVVLPWKGRITSCFEAPKGQIEDKKMTDFASLCNLAISREVSSYSAKE